MDKNKLVIKSNALIEASYRLGLNEQRLILGCIHQIRRDEPVTDQVMYSISVSDFAKTYNLDLKAAYQQLKTAALSLKKREVRITQEPNGVNKRKETLITSWVQSIKYLDGNGEVKLRFSHDMLSYLTELSRCFTSYKLKNVVCMSTSYGVRIYEMLIQWRSIGEREVDIEWLRERLQVEKKYNRIQDFKKRVLEPAVKDINKNSDIKIECIQRKTGKKVTHLVFKFKEKKEKKSYKDISVNGIKRSVIEKKARPGESYEQASLRIKNQEANFS